ncbi:MAG: competence protein ComEC family protein [Cyclobacteriaceae bacterium]|nr:competence protein ComEC family protein [Cyclobacteriaceae bacterium]MDH4298571.1 competence protein ComEC family protein [Cyclobacteriaceae bacterium]MDH5249582.1 competence protein ComEC family protein [Cyclobacteriaceae bacterium]
MLRWIPYAFVRIVLFFCGGILLAIYWPEMLDAPTAQALFIAFAFVFLILAFVRRVRAINPGSIGLACIFLAGFINVQLQTDSGAPDNLLSANLPVEYYRAIITKPAEEKDRSWKFEARIFDASTGNKWHTVQDKILLYASKEDFYEPFRYGDMVLIKGAPRVIQPPANPGEFDYARFLSYKHIYHQHYVRKEDVKFLGNDPPNIFLLYATLARRWADGVLKTYIHGEREQSLASALVLGVKDGLDNDLLKAYAATGSMHVLAVSGLHVGIIYWIILALGKPFHQGKFVKWMVAVITLLILWAYAFVTGLSPSVLRAVTMFSFVAIARPWNQRTNIYNILAVSAFCLLLYDPYQIMSVGFQLSYLAVLGIVALQPGLYRLWEPKSLFWDEVWKISAVSIAAQMATFSLGLFYFHQFPSFFLIANLVVIPGSFGILILGLLTLSVSFMEAIAGGVGWTLQWIITILNGIVFQIEKIPFSHVTDIYINSFQCWVLIGMVVTVYLCFEKRRFTYLIVTAMLSIIFSFSMWIHFAGTIAAPTLTIYNVPGHTAIDFIYCGKAHFSGDAALTGNPAKADFQIQPNRRIHGVRKVLSCDSFRKQFQGCAVFVWGDKTILHIQQKEFWLPDDLVFDYVVISNNAAENMRSVLGQVTAKEVVLDSSNTAYYVRKMLIESAELDVAVYAIPHQGAFTLTI